jgi:hypothetical protein
MNCHSLCGYRLYGYGVALGLGISLAGFSLPAPSLAQDSAFCFVTDDIGEVFDLSFLCGVDPQSSAPIVLGTGDVQATLRWNTIDDLDLAVTDPSGETVSFMQPQVPSRGQLDVDANAACLETRGDPVENIFWPTGEAPTGQYIATVNLFQLCTNNTSIPFSLTISVQGETETRTGTLSPAQPQVSFPFALP